MTTSQHAPARWYASETAGHETHGQTAIANETTGETIAIVYDGKKHGRLLAAAPQMLDALHTALESIGDTYEARDNDSQGEMVRDIIAAAIEAATGEEVPA